MATLTALPLISRLSSKVIRILGCNPGPMTLQGTNTYLVGTGSRRMLIDTGDAETAEKYIGVLDEVLKNENATIEHLVVTHWHHDHIGGVDSVQRLLSKINPLTDPATVWKLPRSAADQDISLAEKTVQWRSLNSEQLLEVEGAKLRVKHTPGHTTDHVCLLMEDEKILFSGDCILGEGTAVFEDLHDYMLSLEKILALEPKTIYPGHGPVLENPVSSIKYYIEHRQKREDQILKVLQGSGSGSPMCEMDIVEHIYKETPKHLWPAAAKNVENHLEKLLKEGKVKGHSGSWTYIRMSE